MLYEEGQTALEVQDPPTLATCEQTPLTVPKTHCMASAGDAISLQQYLDLGVDDIPSSSPAAPPSYGSESE